jgi:plastocyanin
MNRSRPAALAVVVGVLAAPVAAQAATKTVDVGTPRSVQREFNDRLQSDVNAFFPSTVTIHVGDTVRFRPAGFHNVDLPRRGGRPTGLVAPTGQKANANDPAGNPFWFNGQDTFGFAPPLITNQNFGKRLTYTGARAIQSGLPLARRPQPMSVRFRRAGTYTYYCDVHTGMKGRVRVLRSSRRVPSAAADRRSVRNQIARARATATRLASTRPPQNTVYVGVAGAGGVEKFVFQPSTVQVARGTALTFRMAPGTYEVHTATAGPGDPDKEPQSFLGQLAATFQAPAIDPAAFYPSDPPGSNPSLAPNSHGNGFWNSGVLDVVAATPLPALSTVRFDTAGTYTLYCLIHPTMKGTVVVG